MSRRGKGEGSIHQRKDGRWSAVADLGWSNGKRNRKYVYGTTRNAVARRLNKVLEAHESGEAIGDDRMTVEQFLNTWIDGKRSNLRTSTWKRYDGLIRLHAIPKLGKLRMTKLEPHHIQQLYNERLASGVSPASVLYLHRVLRNAFGEANRWGLIGRNVAALVKPPRPERKQINTLNPLEAQALFSAARGDRLEALYVTALTTGMRQGELLGLMWSDIDLNKSVLVVRRSLQVAPGKGREIGPPKTLRSRRRILLHALAVQALTQHKERQTQERADAMGAWTDMDLVFPNIVGLPIDPTNLLRRSFHPLLKRAGLSQIRFHDLRHTAATLLLGQGVHPKIVSEMLGHTQISITLDLYSHVTETMLQAAVDAFDGVFGCCQAACQVAHEHQRPGSDAPDE